jgi:hypothetical protein
VSAREWKPGDVASILKDGAQPAFRTNRGWTYIDGSTNTTDADRWGFRPLVVIDPEDREQVKRLVSLYCDGHNIVADAPIRETGIGYMQAALRTLDAPPECNNLDLLDEALDKLSAVVQLADGLLDSTNSRDRFVAKAIYGSLRRPVVLAAGGHGDDRPPHRTPPRAVHALALVDHARTRHHRRHRDRLRTTPPTHGRRLRSRPTQGSLIMSNENADVLREAAALMRSNAEGVDPWHGWGDVTLPERSGPVAYAEDMSGYLGGEWGVHAGSWHPAVALAVADWLEDTAHLIEWHVQNGGIPYAQPHLALAVARAYLGATS